MVETCMKKRRRTELRITQDSTQIQLLEGLSIDQGMQGRDMWGGKIYVGKGRLQGGMEGACGREVWLDPEDGRVGGEVLGSSAGAAGGGVRGQGGAGPVLSTGVVMCVDAWTLVEARMEGIRVERRYGRGVCRGVFRGPDGVGGVGIEPRAVPRCMRGTVGGGGAVD